MQQTLRLTQTLHQEHEASIGLIERLESVLLQKGPKSPPDVTDGAVAAVLGEFAAAVEGEMAPHFAFEEAELFPRLAEAGDGEIGALLAEEHEVILPIARRLAELAGAARAEGFGAEAWAEFHRLGGEFAERLIAHVQKEEMALLPALEDLLDGEADMALVTQYATAR